MAYARLDGSEALPSWATFARGGPCPASWQTAPAVHGTTFIAYDTALAANVPRYTYCAALGRKALYVEPQRQNRHAKSVIVDPGGSDVPDVDGVDWFATGVGVAGVDFNVITTGGPTGDGYGQIEDSASLDATGFYYANGGGCILAGQYGATSFWTRRPGADIACNVYGSFLNPGHALVALPAGPYDWQRNYVVGLQVADGNYNYSGSTVLVNHPGVLQSCCAQSETNVRTPSSWIPTTGAMGTRQAETFAVDPDVVPFTRGSIELIKVMGYASTDTPTGSAEDVLWTWDGAAGSSFIEYRSTDDVVRVVTNGTQRVITAAGLVFAAGDALQIRLQFEGSLSRLTVNGVSVDGTWVPPSSLAGPGLGRYTGYTEPGAYANVLLAKG